MFVCCVVCVFGGWVGGGGNSVSEHVGFVCQSVMSFPVCLPACLAAHVCELEVLYALLLL